MTSLSVLPKLNVVVRKRDRKAGNHRQTNSDPKRRVVEKSSPASQVVVNGILNCLHSIVIMDMKLMPMAVLAAVSHDNPSQPMRSMTVSKRMELGIPEATVIVRKSEKQ